MPSQSIQPATTPERFSTRQLVLTYLGWLWGWALAGFLRLFFIGIMFVGVYAFLDGVFGDPLTYEYLWITVGCLGMGGFFAFMADSNTKFTSWRALVDLSQRSSQEATIQFVMDTSVTVTVELQCEHTHVRFELLSPFCPAFVYRAKEPTQIRLYGSKTSAWLLQSAGGSCVLAHPKSLRNMRER